MSHAMAERVLIGERELAPYLRGGGLADRARGLLEQQEETWELLRKGYESLRTVETRLFEFDGYAVKVQFNPGRLTSSSAKVDDKSIKERKCFLCPANLPSAQRGFLYGGGYLFLCNPFPIFPEHYTIPCVEHTPQRILPSFSTLLSLTKELADRYTVVYNGPRCGASAPDHLHLQAGDKGFMMFDEEYPRLKGRIGVTLFKGKSLAVVSFSHYLRRFVAFESDNQETLERAFSTFYQEYQGIVGGDEEPMMNILSSFDDGLWRLAVFVRSKHRPSFFFAEGENRILLSPAAVDVGGVCTTPIEGDFRKITRENIVEMFEEVSLEAGQFEALKSNLREALRGTH